MNTKRYKELRNKNIIKLDYRNIHGIKVMLHRHSSYSHDVPNTAENSPMNLLRQAKEQGYLLAITDHDNDLAYRHIRNDKDLWKQYGKYLIRASEIEVHDPKRLGGIVHFGVYGMKTNRISDKLHFIAKQGNAEAFIQYAKKKKAFVVLNHPWWTKGFMTLRPKKVFAFAKKHHIPLELNAKRNILENYITLRKAGNLGLQILVGDDKHVGVIDPKDPTFMHLDPDFLPKKYTKEQVLEKIWAGKARYVFKSTRILSYGKMASRYLKNCLDSDRTELKSGLSPLDLLIKKLSYFQKVEHRGVKGFMNFLAFIFGMFVAIIYIPCTYIASSCKVLRSISFRNNSE
ncbi:MAG: PHP domain-containing protein [Candidatus Woesearchaeota archaeon]